jgi:hypothetical protein
MGSISELDAFQNRRMERLESFTLITAEERLRWLIRNIIRLFFLLIAFGLAILSCSAVLRLDSFLSGSSPWVFLILSVFFCSLGYLACFYGLCKALIRQEFWSRTARCLWPGFFYSIGTVYWHSFSMTSLGLRFCSYLPSSPFAFLFDYFSIEGFVLFFLIGDPTVLYFCVNLILFLLTALFKIVVMLFMATERSLVLVRRAALRRSGKFTSSQGG